MSHLALFIRSLGGGGGAERAVANLATELAHRDHRVDLVLGRAEGHFLDQIPAAVRVVDLRMRSAFAALPQLARDPANGRAMLPALCNLDPPRVLGAIGPLARYLREERPDAMLSALDYSNLTALWARHLSGSPTRLVVSVQNTLSRKAENARAQRFRRLPAILARFYPWADAIASVSDGVADDLADVTGLPRALIQTTHNPVVTPALLAAAAEPIDHPWLQQGEPPVLLGIGKLKPQKDFPSLLRAFARVRATRKLRLVILGDGPMRAELRHTASQLGVEADVDLPGFVPNPFAYLARAAALVLSSTFEGLPSVLIEALATGCPVVATDCPNGPREILSGGRYGPLVPVGDPEALAKGIVQVLDDPPDAKLLEGRARIYSSAAVSERILALLLPRARMGAQRE